MNINSFKEMVEAVVKEAFRKQAEEIISEIQVEAQAKFDKKMQDLKEQAKKQTNRIALEMLQKSDINGISLELKL
jgi:vacuolar-type H+-ATPase subunit H